MPFGKHLGFLLLCVFGTSVLFAQQLKLGKNPSVNLKSAVLELQSDNQGLLMVRIGDTSLINTLAPPDGMVIYFTPTRQLMVRANGYWQTLVQASSLLISNSAWALDGNALSAVKKFGTTTNYDLPFITNNTEQMRLSTNGFLGLGTTAPAGKIHSVTDNSETGDDYIFDDYGASTSQGFFIRKARGTVATPLNLASGDQIGSINFSGRISGAFNYNPGSSLSAFYKGTGTNDLSDLRFSTSSTERMRISEIGDLAIGNTAWDASNPEQLLVDAGTTTSVNGIVARGTINKYFQMNVQNLSAGTSSSADIVATANNGTESTNYVDLGINGQNFSSSGDVSSANDGYLISSGNDFYLINSNAAKDVIVLAGGTTAANEVMRATSGGKLGIGTTLPAAKLDASGTYKLGAAGTVNKNQISFAVAVPASSTVTAGTFSTLGGTYTGGVKDVTVTIPTGTQPSTTQATVVVSPNFDLPANVSIASARLISTTQVKIRFINTSTTAQALTGTLYCTIQEF